MPISEVIRGCRKKGGMTQRELAERLGVTPSAVNKWETGASCPDITLLAPIARALGITTDTLLDYQEEISEAQTEGIIKEAETRLRDMPYEEAFAWARDVLERYPSSYALVLQLAVMLDAHRTVHDIPDEDNYDDYICSLYQRALSGGDEDVRRSAADLLFGYYCRKERCDEAERLLDRMDMRDPERKRKQAQIYASTGRAQEAYQAYEELLFSYYQLTSAVLQGIYMLAQGEGDVPRARLAADKQAQLARCFDMGGYYEASCGLELAAADRDAERTLTLMEQMLAGTEKLFGFQVSPLYEHMHFKQPEEGFAEELKASLLNCFAEGESFGFLRGNERYEALFTGTGEKR